MAFNRPEVIASAEKLVSRGKIEAAIKEYRKLLAENPNDASTLNRLGDLYARIDRIDEAVRLFSQIADRYTDDGFFVKAIAIFKKIIKLDPTRLAVYERLAELYHKQGLVPEARTQYQVLVDYYQKHDNPASAISVLQRMVILVPDDPAPHVKLAELFHGQQLTDKALAEYRLIADLMLRHSKVDEATQVYAKAIAAEPGNIAFITDAVLGLKDGGHIGAAARLLALAVEKNPQAEKIARIAGLSGPKRAPEVSQPSTATLKVSDVTQSGADSREILQLDSSVLEESMFPAAQIAPTAPAVEPARPAPPKASAPSLLPSIGDSELDFVLELPGEMDLPSTQVIPTDEMKVRSSESPWFEGGQEPEIEFDLDLDGPQTIEPVTAPAPAPPSAAGLSTPAAPAAPPTADEAYEIDWNFEPEPVLDIPAVAPPGVETPVLNLEELERTSYEVVPSQVSPARRQDDLLAEAEVFRKYGLREKAHDRVRELLQVNPRHVGANGLLVTLWIDEGKYEKALARANQLVRLAKEGKDDTVWNQVRNRLLKAGFHVEGDQVVALPAATPKKRDKISALLDDLAGVKSPIVRPAAKPAAARKGAPAAIAPIVPPVASAPVVPASEPSTEPWHAGLHDVGPLDDELPGILIPIAPPAKPVPAVPPVAMPVPAEAVQAPPPAASVTPERIAADESLSWLDQAVAAPVATDRSDDEKLFDDEEGFFDLAAELEQELSKEDLLTGQDLMPTPQEQSLEEIVEGFKRGVSESLSAEDYDTHYNLGIAYREMGLLDEAIGEFQLASKEPRYLVDCASLLGGCFLEKGLPELAIKWFQRGLEIPNLAEDAFLGMLYDLGNVYVYQNDLEKARKTFVEIYGVNSNYRDVVAKLAELDPAH